MIQPLSRFADEMVSAGGSASSDRGRASTRRSDETFRGEEEAAAETPAPDAGALATKQTFLTLLVAQIKNQNPLNPADGTEFLSQLAQFSELEQLISIREELEAIGKSIRSLAPADGAVSQAAVK